MVLRNGDEMSLQVNIVSNTPVPMFSSSLCEGEIHSMRAGYYNIALIYLASEGVMVTEGK